jgi:hypothetical protein
LPANRLGRLQRDILDAFFRQEGRFFLSGGGALSGFHLGHRETDDLDLFALEDALDDGLRALSAAAAEIAAEKPVLHGIRIDPAEEIFANKLSALLSRAEIRDLVDVRPPRTRA